MSKRKILKFICLCMVYLLTCTTVYGERELKTTEDESQLKLSKQLYAQAAVLMDGSTGKVLFEKNGDEVKAMASTTKIMTCIIALENGDLDSVVKVSKYAASMPDVQLNIKEGEMYRLKDLLYSLMLESHNDSAVAIAEHIAGSVDNFCELMNKKALELGCNNTYFITPNGLDGEKEVDGVLKKHSTTARDLAIIMKYCILNEQFLEITRTPNHTFKNIIQNDKGEYSSGNITRNAINRNALLKTMDGIISGKTGFTNDAGYCYVCAYENNGRVYIVTLLGCGWPNNKNYKWADTKKLIEYGKETFVLKDFFDKSIQLPQIKVAGGITSEYYDFGKYGLGNEEDIYINSYIAAGEVKCLGKEGERIKPVISIRKELKAPVNKGQVVGKITYVLDEGIEKSFDIYAGESIDKKDFQWSFGVIFRRFVLH